MLRGQPVGAITPALVGLPGRAGPQDALRAVPHDDAGRLRRRRPRRRGPGRRGARWRTCARRRRRRSGHITRLVPYRRGEMLALDEMTRRSLELTRTLREGKREGSLLQVIDRTVTPMGARLLAEWLTSPLTSSRRSPSGSTPSPSCSASRPPRRPPAMLSEAHDLERLSARVGPAGPRRATWSPWPGRWPCSPRSRPG